MGQVEGAGGAVGGDDDGRAGAGPLREEPGHGPVTGHEVDQRRGAQRAQRGADVRGCGHVQQCLVPGGAGQRLQDPPAQPAGGPGDRGPSGEQHLLAQVGHAARALPLPRELRQAELPQHVGHGGGHGRRVQDETAPRVEGPYGVGVGAVGQAPAGHVEGLAARHPGGLRGMGRTGLEKGAPGGRAQALEADAAGGVVVQASDARVVRVRVAPQAVGPGQVEARAAPQRVVGSAGEVQGVPQPGDALVEVEGAVGGWCELQVGHDAVADAEPARDADPPVVVGFEQVQRGLPQGHGLQHPLVVQGEQGPLPHREGRFAQFVGLGVDRQAGDPAPDLLGGRRGVGPFGGGFEPAGAPGPQVGQGAAGGFQVRFEREAVHVVGRQPGEGAFENLDLLGQGRLVLAAEGLVDAEQGDLRAHHQTLVRGEVRGLGEPGHVVDGRVEVVLAAAQLAQVGPQSGMDHVQVLARPGAGRMRGPGPLDPGQRRLQLRGVGEVPQAPRAVFDDDVRLPRLVRGPVLPHRLPEFLLLPRVGERPVEPQQREQAEDLTGPQPGRDTAPGQSGPVRVQAVVGLAGRRTAQPLQHQSGQPGEILTADDAPRPLLDLPQQRLRVVRCRHVTPLVPAAAARSACGTAPARR